MARPRSLATPARHAAVVRRRTCSDDDAAAPRRRQPAGADVTGDADGTEPTAASDGRTRPQPPRRAPTTARSTTVDTEPTAAPTTEPTTESTTESTTGRRRPSRSPQAAWTVQPGWEQVAVLDAEPGLSARPRRQPTARSADGRPSTSSASLLFRDVEPGQLHACAAPRSPPTPFEVAALDERAAAVVLRRPAAAGRRVRLPRDPRRDDAVDQRRRCPARRRTAPTRPWSSTPATTRATRTPARLRAAVHRPSATPTSASTCAAAAAAAARSRSSRTPSCSTATTPSRRSPPSRGCTATRSAWSASPTPASASSSSPPTQPPSLAAITPLSVIDDSYRGVLYPGGILNTGFAVEWTQRAARRHRARGPGRGRPTASPPATRSAPPTSSLRLQNPDLVAEIRDHPYLDRRRSATRCAPRTFVDQIEVPVFLAGAWQDEQTGGRFATMLDRFTGTDHFYATLVQRAAHRVDRAPRRSPGYVEFLDLYVGRAGPVAGRRSRHRAGPRRRHLRHRPGHAARRPVRRPDLRAGAARRSRPSRRSRSCSRRAPPTASSPAPRCPAGHGVVRVVAGPRRTADRVVPRPPAASRRRHRPERPAATSYTAEPGRRCRRRSSTRRRVRRSGARTSTWQWQEPPEGTAASFVSAAARRRHGDRSARRRPTCGSAPTPTTPTSR